jgi:hypothetical protein
MLAAEEAVVITAPMESQRFSSHWAPAFAKGDDNFLTL